MTADEIFSGQLFAILAMFVLIVAVGNLLGGAEVVLDGKVYNDFLLVVLLDLFVLVVQSALFLASMISFF